MGQSQSVSEATSTATTTTGYFTDSFNKTFNRINNYENVGNISLGDSALASTSGKAMSTEGSPTQNFMPLILAAGGLVVIIILIAFARK